MELVNLKQAQRDELKKMQALIDYDVDKRLYFDLENNYKVLEDQNRVLLSEIMQLRKTNDLKDEQVNRVEKKLAEA